MTLPWDTEIDTPATIAIIGGGPAGIEAALYARFLGYSVELFDQNKVGDSLLLWGDRLMAGNWREVASSLGLAALEAHGHAMPELDKTPTHREYVEQYLLPNARNDLLYSSIHIHTPVLGISRLGCSSLDHQDLNWRSEQEFRLWLSSAQRGEFSQVVDIVLDCSGSQNSRAGMASGGGMPIGWTQWGSHVLPGRRAILTKERDKFSGKRVLLWGHDPTAIANAIDLCQLAQSSGTQLYWVVPKQHGSSLQIADKSCGDSPLTYEEITQAERNYREADSLSVVSLAAWGIEAISQQDSQFLVTLQTTPDETADLRVDQIIDCGTCFPEPNFKHRLHLEKLEQEHRNNLMTNADETLTQEPHFYRLGGRSFCSTSVSAYVRIRQQIRAVFAMVGGRAELDLYQSVQPQNQH